jgi:hypothetical protein
VSSEGFAAITRREYAIGSTIRVEFSFQAQTVCTNARVQTLKLRPDGKFRYGFYVAEKGSPARKALSAISLAVQRQQLKRLSGTAA